MNNKIIHRFFGGIALLLSGCLTLPFSASCSKWTDPEPLGFERQTPADRNPELWAKYLEVLNAYKQGSHFLSYGKFVNGHDKITDGSMLLRALPDSLDIVSLVNAGRMTDIDREGVKAVRAKGTKVLYGVDYAAMAAELFDDAKLGAYLDKVLAEASDLDGFSFTGIPQYGGTEAFEAARKAARLIVSKLSAVAGQGKDKLLVFEGNPDFLSDEDLAKLSLLVLDTEKLNNVTDLKIKVGLALSRAGLGKERLLLCATPDGEIVDEENVKLKALEELTDRVASLGPLAGIAVADIGKAYYDPARRYGRVCRAIRLMNP